MDQCEKCKNIYANYLEFIIICFKCHKTLCINCCDKIICPDCIKEVHDEIQDVRDENYKVWY